MKLKIAVCVTLAVLLQTGLAQISKSLVAIDLPLIVTAYFALRRDPVQSMIIGACAGLGSDVFSTGLLGAQGFSKTLAAYAIAALSTRMTLDNPLLRIPVLAGAVALDAVVVVFLHRMLGQPSLVPFAEVAAYKLIGTTATGTFIFYLLDVFFSERARQRRHFAFRRRAARRSLARR